MKQLTLTYFAVCMFAMVTFGATLPSLDQLRIKLGALPLSFEPNRGQGDATVQFLARGPGGSLFLGRDKAWLIFPDEKQTGDRGRLGLSFVGGNFALAPEGFGALSGKANYLLGADSGQWLTNIALFNRVRYREIYPGIDAVFYGNAESLEYDLIAKPGSDPAMILLRFEGADKITLDPNGDLMISIGKNSIRQHKPNIYQEIAGQWKAIAGGYQLHSAMEVGISIADYDRSQPLTIDPVLSYSATLGGSGMNNGLAVGVDTNDNVYITGNTTANNFPTKGAYQSAFAGNEDAFVTKLDTNGAIVYSTYLGGGVLNNINQGSSGQGIAVDIYGDAFVVGWTQVTNFPVKNALQSTNGGICDAFVAELNPAGNGLLFSTYLGGKGLDAASGIALDTNANVLITGYTESTNLPTASAAQPVYGGNGDTFVAKISNDGSTLMYSTYLGGSNSENNAGSGLLGIAGAILPHVGGSIAVDFNNNAYVTGWTFSTNFPTVNAFQPTNSSGLPNYNPVAFLTKIDPNGNTIYSSYFGGSALNFGSVYGRAIGVDVNHGNVYLAGSSSAANLPMTNAFQSYMGAAGASIGDGFVAAFDPTLTNLVYCTYLGGTGDDQINGLAVRDVDGSVALTGSTSSSDFPLLNAVQTNGKQGFFKSMDGAASWSTPNSSLSGNATVYAILVDPFNTATIYAVTRNGFFKSTDSGNTWNFAGTGLGGFSAPFNSQANNELAADPQHPGILYVGCFNGVYKSTNSAATWSTASAGLPASPSIQALAIDPQNPSTIYAGTYSAGVYKSIDGGNSWSVATNGLNNLQVTALAVDPLNSSNVLVGVQNYNNTCLFKSSNAGTNWTAVSGMPADPFGEHTIVAFGTYSSSIYAVVGNIIEDANFDVSTNGGATWTSQLLAQGFKITTLAVGGPALSAPALTIAQAGNNEIISWPSGLTNYVLQFSPTLNSPNWQPVGNTVNNAVTNPVSGAQGFYRLIGTNNNSSPLPTLYLGTDATSGQGVFKSVDGGASWNAMGFAGDTISAVAVNTANPAQVYAGLNGKNTGFIATLDPAGQLDFASYLGGSGNDSGNALAVLDENNVIAVGSTTSKDFPVNATISASIRPKITVGPLAAGFATIATVQAAIKCPADFYEKPIILQANHSLAPRVLESQRITQSILSVTGLPPGMSYTVSDSTFFNTTEYDYVYLYGTPSTPGTYTISITYTDYGCTYTVKIPVTVQ